MNRNDSSFIHDSSPYLDHAEGGDRHQVSAWGDRGHPAYVPTPTDILRETEAIRASWTPEVERMRGRLSRSIGKRRRTPIRIIRTCEIDWPSG